MTAAKLIDKARSAEAVTPDDAAQRENEICELCGLEIDYATQPALDIDEGDEHWCSVHSSCWDAEGGQR